MEGQYKIRQQIKSHLDKKTVCNVHRKVAEETLQRIQGYILDYSEHFVLMQMVDDFRVDGYTIFSLESISVIQYGENEKYLDKIIHWEKQTRDVSKKYDVDLTTWTSIFRTIKKTGGNVIIQNEDPADYTFDIGPIIKSTSKAVYIRYFNAAGKQDKELTKIPFSKITSMSFDTHYINVISKYIRSLD